MIRKLLFLVLFLGLFAEVQAQQGKLDITFNTLDNGLNGDGFDKTVRTLSLQSDDKLIVGGEYLNLNGIPTSYLTRLNPDGSIDDSFNSGTGFNGKVYTSVIQTDGKIIVAGNFTSYNGNNSGRLIRLNPDGSQDTTFNTAIGATN
ncbi:MAG: delta-60 repeat domain-containing protein, partial [Flavobacterium sp.]